MLKVRFQCLPKPVFALALILVLQWAAFAQEAYQPTAEEQEYIDKFIEYQKGANQIPAEPVALEQYATRENWDRRFRSSLKAHVDRINTEQNRKVNMGWSSSYYSDALNVMYRATKDAQYLRDGLELARATLANRDVDKGFATFYGPISPAWGTDYYSKKWVVHTVHTGIIAYGVLECLRLVKGEAELLAELGDEYQSMLDKTLAAINWEDRVWVEGPAEDEGHYIFKHEEFNKEGQPAYEGEVQPGNRLSAMGLALWTAWNITGEEVYRDKALKLARFMKRHMGLYRQDENDVGAWGWGYWLEKEPVANPLPAADWRKLRSGEDFSHAGLTAAFPLMMAVEGQVWTRDDLRAFGNTIKRGAARMNNGILFGNVGGLPTNGPGDVQSQSYWFKLLPYDREAWQRLVDFQLKYQANPRDLDLASLIESLANQPAAK